MLLLGKYHIRACKAESITQYSQPEDDLNAVGSGSFLWKPCNPGCPVTKCKPTCSQTGIVYGHQSISLLLKLSHTMDVLAAHTCWPVSAYHILS